MLFTVQFGIRQNILLKAIHLEKWCNDKATLCNILPNKYNQLQLHFFITDVFIMDKYLKNHASLLRVRLSFLRPY